MAFNCRLNRNITLAESPTTSVGRCGSVTVGGGGIRGRVYVYNISDVTNLVFENDMRFDDSLVISDIVTKQSYFYIDCTSASYNESYEDEAYSHTLTFTIANSLAFTEDALSDATHSRYLVAFKLNGDEDYKVFGWKEGAELSYSLEIGEDSNAYTVTFSQSSQYPLMSCYGDNFNLSSKVFSPIWNPLYEIAYCVQENGHNNGYAIASYVVKVNNSGEALDSDNKLCSYSGKKQDAYKFNGVPNGNYNIIGTYGENGSYDGKVVKVYDPQLCPINVSGTITASNSNITFDSSHKESSITLTTTDNWKVITSSTLASVSPQRGNGNATLSIRSTNVGGSDAIVIQNTATFERISINVKGYFIKGLDDVYSFGSDATSFILSPTVESANRNALNITSPIPYTNVGNNVYEFDLSGIGGGEYTITFAITEHAQESKNVKIVKSGTSPTEPNWVLITDYCEYD